MSVENRMKALLEGRDYVSVLDDHAEHINTLRRGIKSCLAKFGEYDGIVSDIVGDNSYYAAERKLLASTVGAEIQKAERGFQKALEALNDIIAGRHSGPTK